MSNQQSTIEVLLHARNDTMQAFDDFCKQLTNVTTGYVKAAEGSKTFGTSLTEWIQHPFESAKGAAGAFLEELGPTGLALGVFTGVAAAAGAEMFRLAEHASEAGEHVLDFSRMTGVGVQDVGALEYAVDVAGSSLGQMETILQQLARRMEAGGPSLDKMKTGLAEIGVNFDAFQGMSPTEQIAALSEGFRRGSSTGHDMATAIDIMGRAGAQSLPFLKKDLADLIEIGKDKGVPWSAASAADAERFGEQTRAFSEALHNVGIEIGQSLMPAMILAVEGTTRLAEAFVHVADLGGLVSGSFHMITGALGEEALAAQTALAKQDTIVKAISAGAPLTVTYAEAVKYVNEQYQAQHAFMGPVLTDAEQLKRNRQDATEAERLHAQELRAAETAAKAMAAAMADLNSVGSSWEVTLQGIDGNTEQAIEWYLRAGVSQSALMKAYGLTAEQIKAVAEDVKLQTALFQVEHGVVDGMTASLERLGERGTVSLKTLKDQIDDLGRHGMQASRILMQLGGSLDPNIVGAVTYGGANLSGAPNVSPGGADALKQAGETNATDWLDGFGMSLQKDLGPNILKAFQGGGDVLKTIGGTVGNDLGATIGKSMGGALGSAMGPLGSMIGGELGGMITTAIASIGAPSAAELASRTSRADFMKQFTPKLHDEGTPQGVVSVSDSGFADMLAKIGPTLERLGYNGAQTDQIFRHMLDAKTPAEFAAAMGPINEATKTMASVSSDVNSIVGEVQSKWAGHVVPDAMKAQIEQLAQMKGLTEDERTALLNLTKDARPNFEQLRQTASGLGITLADLGPNFEQGDLEDKFKTVNQNIVDLQHAGGNLDGILRGYAPTINSLVQESLQFGTKIPDNMKPWIQGLLTAGGLTDAAGNKITTLAGLSFEGTPVDDTLKSLDGTMDHLKTTLDGLPHQIELAFLAAQGNPFAHWGILPPPGNMADFHLENGEWVPNLPPAPPVETPGPKTPNSWAATGGLVMESGIQYMTSGGPVLPFRPRGEDRIPIMARIGESVLTPEATNFLGPEGLSDLNAGRFGRFGGRGQGETRPGGDTSRMEQYLQEHIAVAQRQTQMLERHMRELPIMIRHAVRGT